jgi:hypothetical protein
VRQPSQICGNANAFWQTANDEASLSHILLTDRDRSAFPGSFIILGVQDSLKAYPMKHASMLGRVCAALVWCQLDRAALLGTVTDPSGAMVPDVKIIVTQTATGAMYE